MELQIKWVLKLTTDNYDIMEKSSWEKEGQLHKSSLAAKTEKTKTG